MTGRLLLRGLAIAIAVLGLVDPAITSERAIAPTIAVLAGDSGAATHAAWQNVSSRLASRYRVVDHRLADAAATVLVGNAVPAGASRIASPAFVVTPETSQPAVTITGISAPESAALNARVPVTVTARARHAQGRTIDLAISSASGVVLDRIDRPAGTADDHIEATLHVTGLTTGAAAFDVSAAIRDAAAVDRAGTLVVFGDTPWPVLVFDRRPSWASTFLRRALERDARFVVTSRTMTSAGLASDRGQPPPGLGAADRLDRYAVIVVGAPDALTDADARALELFARRRGGAIVTVVEEPPAAATTRLMGVARWDRVTSAEPDAVTSAGGTAMQATEFIVPDRAPEGALAIARAAITKDRPVVFDRAIGAGRIIVSGAADSWRHRGVPETSAFDRFWCATIAAAAAAAPPEIAITPATAVLAPGGDALWRIVVRRDALGTASAAEPISAQLQNDAGAATPVRLWPDGAPGRYVATAEAPRAAGLFRLVVTNGTSRGEATMSVSSTARTIDEDDENLIRAWVASRGGRVVSSADLTPLDRALADTLHPEHRATRWWPMRSAWWILPFAGLLSVEWWLRRHVRA